MNQRYSLLLSAALLAVVSVAVPAFPASAQAGEAGAATDCSGAHVSIVQTPSAQSACPGSNAAWTIIARNDGPCPLDTLVVADTLGGGMPFVLTVPASTGDASHRTWSFSDLAPGDSVRMILVATLPDTCPEGGPLVNAVGAVGVHLVTGADPDTVTGHATATVDCSRLGVSITKSLDATAVGVGDEVQVTLTVSNTGTGTLDLVEVCDSLDPGVTFDTGQTIGGTCGATYAADGTPNHVCFSPFSLDPGDSCTIIYNLGCGGKGTHPDTATVTAYCTDSQAGPVTDTAAGSFDCGAGHACPRSIGFWRQQCAQKENGSTKVCLDGMYTLWRCVINTTGVREFKLNQGGLETAASLRGLSDRDLFAHLCRQLEGPRPMTLRDMAEIQYLGLMLNYCAGALSSGIPVENAFSGTVGAAIDSIEVALNLGVNLGYWEQVADGINNGVGVLAQECPEGENLFRNVSPCGAGGSPSAGFDFLTTGSADRLMARAYPNPALHGGGTTIYYNVPAKQAGGTVRLTVYDIAGRLVKELANVPASAGVHTTTWDLRDDSGSRVSSGVYFYRLQAGGDAVVRKMLVLQN